MSIWKRITDAVSSLDIGEGLRAVLLGRKNRDEGEDISGGTSSDGPATDQIAFTIGVIALGAKMAKADGQVTRDEVAAFKEVFVIPPGEESNVSRIFNLARQDVAGFEGYAHQVARLFRQHPAVLEDVLDGLFHIAKADDQIAEAELLYLAKVAEIFGFSEVDFERIRCTHMQCEETDPYKILGVERSVDDETLKKTYRVLVRETHPDAMMARGVPPEFLTMATEKLASINVAYDRIRKERGLT